ncbi:MAG: iron dicitrate transport regulator FecR [Candidatus Dactylopiibacterium carminicum]|uniref:Iron dicitrate transport regulator FecR n=1 Tax=Candidatus Dactylopiibacterium carminicum TaxID=857335 RepID=A0A272EX00_9RHOO|nr:FecR domain-containing protein [Candidatus Dactylopiibacterium carminicum]KAF7599881.1 iron dicitrate transport regulator FecR [Candidatus Dactylopiibacterium carminicum]PAS94180.1 MAG: iron dicitrate transport regulator FecR [Candidatus Dactylopiibacterium carminicum]PAS96748.1 MAG: iron dicitrate transport regulator FecR [Candidatus Dactylopiibacterium carminicum]PAS99880.1 MAG: hypothetical protein BSR46_05385 [Candidatus Dactylopiibacterium carminicum]
MPESLPVADKLLYAEAAEWLLRFQSGERSESLQAEFERWRARSPGHAAAWQRAEAVLGCFGRVPAGVTRQTLGGLPHPGRRRALRVLGLCALGTSGALALRASLPWQAWQADLRTATGERQHHRLADGSLLVLDTASAVDVLFTAQERRLRLHRGKLMLTTAPDLQAPSRPFVVETEQALFRPVGTRFSVWQQPGSSHLAVFEGAVEVTTGSGARHLVRAGEQASFGAMASGRVGALAPGDDLWTDGMLIARDMRLADWVAELSRYHAGVLRCDPAVAELRVSGAFPLDDTEASLDMLVRTRPLQLQRLTRYWTRLLPARS